MKVYLGDKRIAMIPDSIHQAKGCESVTCICIPGKGQDNQRNGQEEKMTSQSRKVANTVRTNHRKRIVWLRLCMEGTFGEGAEINVTFSSVGEGPGDKGHRFWTVNVGLTCCDDDALAKAAAVVVICKSAPWSSLPPRAFGVLVVFELCDT